MIPLMSKQHSVVSSAKLIAICTLLSRITGLAREMLFAQAFGLQWIQDAFFYAFQVPNLFRRLLGEGAMAAVFVPSFTQVLEREGRAAAWQLLARTLALLCVALIVIILALQAVILAVWFLVTFNPETQESWQLLLSLTAIMLPFMLTICVLALFSAILNCLGSFVPAALAPVLLNLCMIGAIGWLAPALRPDDAEAQIYVVSWTVVVAGLIQILFILPVLRGNGVRLGWRFELRNPAVKRMLRLLLPVALGQGVLAFGVFLDAQICILLTHRNGTPVMASWLGFDFAYPLEEGALSALTYAQRLYQFPLGVLVISLATAAMPAFSRLAARGDWPAWAAEVRQSLRLAVFEGILAGTMMILLAAPIVRLLFQYGEFTAADTARTSRILVFYGVAMWAFCAQHIILRGFYSSGDVRTPLKISAAVLPLNVLLTLLLIWSDTIREGAFAISSAITSGLAVIIGVLILQRRADTRLLDRPLLTALARMLLAAACSALALLALRPLMPAVPALVPAGLCARVLDTFVPLVVGSGVFLLAAWLLRLPEVTLLIAHPRSRGSDKS